MGLLETLEHKGRKYKYELIGNRYNSCAKKLRTYSDQVAKYISSCEEKLKNINVDGGDSTGDVIENFKEGIDNYKSKISGVIEEANENKSTIDRAIEEAIDIANKYYMLADEEERASQE